MNLYISIRGEQKGPYTLSQVETMWDNGTLTADALYRVDGTQDWRSMQELKFPAKASRLPVMSFVFLGLILVAVALGTVVYFQHKAKQAQAAKITSQMIEGAVDAGFKEAGQILAARQKVQATLTDEFNKTLMGNMQVFLDNDIAKTLGAAFGDASPKPSGLTATDAKLDALDIQWPQGGKPHNVEEALGEVSTYTAVYTIFWKQTYGTGTGNHQFESVIDFKHGKTISVRTVKMNATPQ